MAVLVFWGMVGFDRLSNCSLLSVALVEVPQGLEGGAALGHVWSQCRRVQNHLELVGGANVHQHCR